jgi:hypothetical protein
MLDDTNHGRLDAGHPDLRPKPETSVPIGNGLTPNATAVPTAPSVKRPTP